MTDISQGTLSADSVAARRLPVTVLSGVLGAGKTTFLRDWQSEDSSSDRRLAISEGDERSVTDLLAAQVEFLRTSGC